MCNSAWKFLICSMVLLLFIMPEQLFSQTRCGSNVPAYTIDMTGNPDSVWTSPNIGRRGQCCGTSSPDRCIVFTVKLDPMASGINVTSTGGSSAYSSYINCTTSFSLNSDVCLTGGKTYYITICKPGSNKEEYTITSLTKPYLSDQEIYIQDNCPQTVTVYGLKTSTITWKSISGSRYDSSLSCKTKCSSTTFTALKNNASYVDYQVCGTPTSSCISSWCDTVRVYYVSKPEVKISPYKTGSYCQNKTGMWIKAVASKGVAPYTYKWSTGSTNDSIYVSSGTYWVKIYDALNCNYALDTVKITKDATPTANAGSSVTVCESNAGVSISGTVTGGTGTWSGGSGVFLYTTNNLTGYYIPSASEIAAGTATITLSVTNACGTVTSNKKITINAAPKPYVTGNSVVCSYTGDYAYTTPSHSGSSYNWKVIGGTITSGQNTNTIKVSWDTAGAGYVYVTETNSKGCEAVSAINTISQLDFNTNPISKATVGKDAVSYDTDAYSVGKSATVWDNCGGSKGLDLAMTSNDFNYKGQISLHFKFRRYESEASFFERGPFKLNMQGGNVYITYSVKDLTTNTTQTIGPTNTGYSIPMDGVFRDFVFCFDSIQGNAWLNVDGNQIWSKKLNKHAMINWRGSGNARVGKTMDANSTRNGVLDYAIMGSPINIYPRSDSTFTGNDTLCFKNIEEYSYDGDTSLVKLKWTVTNGTLTTTDDKKKITVNWNKNTGTGVVSLEIQNLQTGCKNQNSSTIHIKPAPSTSRIYH